MEPAAIIAQLNLYAVLPRLEDLVRLDAEARQIARGLRLALQFRVVRGPYLRLSILEGQVAAARSGFGLGDVGLLYPSVHALNRSFAGQRALPIPYGSLWKLGALKQFTALTERLTQHLQPTESDLGSTAFRAHAVELMLLTGLAGVEVVAQHDPMAQVVLSKLPEGTVLVEVGAGPQAHIEIRDGRIRSGAGGTAAPDATITFDSVDTALGLFLNTLDVYAAVGTGQVRVSGLLPLADDVNWLLDRVGRYLN